MVRCTAPAPRSLTYHLRSIPSFVWSGLSPEKLFFQTAYIRLFPNEPISTFQRWHLTQLSPQAALLK